MVHYPVLSRLVPGLLLSLGCRWAAADGASSPHGDEDILAFLQTTLDLQTAVKRRSSDAPIGDLPVRVVLPQQPAAPGAKVSRLDLLQGALSMLVHGGESLAASADILLANVSLYPGRRCTKACIFALLLLGALLLWRQKDLPQQLLKGLREAGDSPAAGSIISGIANGPVAGVMLCGGLYVMCSALLIKSTKYLASTGRFPFAVNLALGHQATGSICLLLLYRACPSAFGSLADPERRAAGLSPRFLLLGAMPIATCFSAQLALSSFAYIYVSVAFLQMQKEGTLVLTYSLSVVARLESCSLSRVHVLCCLLLSTILTIQGEMFFDRTGFLAQGGSQILEAVKLVVQSSVLSAAGPERLDTFSYNLVMQSLSSVVLLAFLLLSMGFIPGIDTASWADYVAWWPHLAGNALVALALNMVATLFIARTSAVGFIIVGIVKDAFLVLSDVMISGTHLSPLQICAFNLQLLFVAIYSFLKVIAARQLERDSLKPKMAT